MFNTIPDIFCFDREIIWSFSTTDLELSVLLNNKLERFCCNAYNSSNAPCKPGSFASAKTEGEIAIFSPFEFVR